MISGAQLGRIPATSRRARLWLASAAALALSLGGCVYAPPPPAPGGYAYAPDAYYYPYYYSPYYYPPAYYSPVYGSVGFFFGGHRHFH